MIGISLQKLVSLHQRRFESKDSIRVATALIATMAALVLGFMVASAKDSYDTKRRELRGMAAKVIYLDRLLRAYGPEARDARNTLRQAVEEAVSLHPNQARSDLLEPKGPGEAEAYGKIEGLVPANDNQRALKSAALRVAFDIGQARWLLFEERGGFIVTPFVVILAMWLTFIFLGFGLFAPPNPAVIVALVLCSFSVSARSFSSLSSTAHSPAWCKLRRLRCATRSRS